MPDEPQRPLDDLGDLTNKVVVLRDGVMDRPEEEHPLLIWGGFGTKPRYSVNSGSKIFGVCLACGDEAAARREFVERVVEPEELTPEQRDQLAATLDRLAQERARHLAGKPG